MTLQHAPRDTAGDQVDIDEKLKAIKRFKGKQLGSFDLRAHWQPYPLVLLDLFH